MKIILVLICLSTVSSPLFCQDKVFIEYEDTFKFIGDGTSGYNLNFIVKSKDPRFRFDSYSFFIPNGITFDKKIKLELLRKKLDFDISKITKVSDLEEMESCLTHEMFSLSKDIYLLKKENGVYYYWKIFYRGTVKDLLITGYQGKI